MALSSHRSYFNDFDKELYRKGPLAVIGHISMILIELQGKWSLAVIGHVSFILIRNCGGNVKEIAPTSYRSYVNDFDRELRKLPRAVIGHVSMSLIANCKGNGP